MLPEAARIAAGIIAAAATVFSVVYMAWLSGRRLDIHPSLSDFSVAQRSARNTAILFVSGIAERALFWGFWIVALRILGPTGNGEYAFATNLFVYFAAVTNFGLSTLVSREVARRREDLLTIFGNALVLRLLVLLAGAPVMVLLAVAYRVGDSISDVTVVVTILIAISLIPSSINQAYAAVYAGFERADFRGAVAIGTALFTVGAGVLALLIGAGLIGLGAVAIAGGVLTFATLARPLGYKLLGTYKLAARRELGEMARSATPLMLNELLANVFFQIDILVIQSLQGTEMVGKYNASYKFIAALTVIPVAVALPLFPALVRAASNPEELGRWFVRAWRFLVLIGLPIVVVFTVFADGIVRSFWGEQFLPEGGDVLRIFIWFLPFALLNAMFQQVLISIDRLRTIATSFVVATALNLALNLTLLPVFGIVAAAYATVIAEIALLILYGAALRGRGLLGRVPGPLLKPAFAAAVMAGIAIPVGSFGWFAGAVAGGVAYAAVTFATGGVSRGELVSAYQAIRTGSR